MVGRPGSPRIAKAAQLLIENEKFTAKVALLMAGYDQSVACSSKAQKTVSKKKQRVIDAVRRSVQKEKMRSYRTRLPLDTITINNQNSTSNSNRTGVSSLTSTNTLSSSTSNEGVAAALVSLSNSTSTSNGTTKNLPKKAPTKKRIDSKITARSRTIATDSRRTPQQVNKFHIQKKKADENRSAAYREAISDALSGKSYAQAARDASKKYNLDVKADTVRKCILKGESTVQKTGPKGKISEEEYNAIKTAFLSYLAISQMNGDAEKKN